MADATPEKPINASVLAFPGVAGLGGLIAALLAAIVTGVNGLTEANIPNTVQVGILGVVGAGLLATAIASAGDAVARSYAVANTVEAAKDQSTLAVKPALQVAAATIAEALTASQSSGAGAGGHGLVPLPVQLEVTVDGNDHYQAIAARQLDGKELEYLAGPPGRSLHWHAANKVTRAKAIAPTPQPQVVALPTPVAIRNGRNEELWAIMVRLDDGEPSALLAAMPGRRYEWVPALDLVAR